MSRTAYRAAEADLAEQVRRAELDLGALNMPLLRCELSKCRATCCHDGVVVGEDEIKVMEGVLDTEGKRLRAFDWWAEECFAHEDGHWKTATHPAPPGKLGENFPSHFKRKRCVFLDEAHRCVLQRLAMDDEGRHPWFWKPISCWMHPLLLKAAARRGEPPLLTIVRGGDDSGFADCTPCGHMEPSGRPAWEALREELEFLGEIGGRDLIKEVRDRS